MFNYNYSSLEQSMNRVFFECIGFWGFSWLGIAFQVPKIISLPCAGNQLFPCGKSMVIEPPILRDNVFSHDVNRIVIGTTMNNSFFILLFTLIVQDMEKFPGCILKINKSFFGC